mmetsp:Transcript_11397/g.15542  ORF Transcript_11397/g.15542 Transcript_11397/m.15542 type:complete len:144 (+) Transcript_11397:351-782(+)
MPLAFAHAELPISVSGGCHCRSVRFTCYLPNGYIDVYTCNCSICVMKQNAHFVVPESSFHLLDNSQGMLTTYTFGTHTAKHMFCLKCGVQSFYRPRSNPTGIAVTYTCLDKQDREEKLQIVVKEVDGENWEEQIKHSDILNKT